MGQLCAIGNTWITAPVHRAAQEAAQSLRNERTPGNLQQNLTVIALDSPDLDTVIQPGRERSEPSGHYTMRDLFLFLLNQ